MKDSHKKILFLGLKWVLRVSLLCMLYETYQLYLLLTGDLNSIRVHADVGRVIVYALLTCLNGYLLVNCDKL